jgi:hypothetical protein
MNKWVVEESPGVYRIVGANFTPVGAVGLAPIENGKAVPEESIDVQDVLDPDTQQMVPTIVVDEAKKDEFLAKEIIDESQRKSRALIAPLIQSINNPLYLARAIFTANASVKDEYELVLRYYEYASYLESLADGLGKFYCVVDNAGTIAIELLANNAIPANFVAAAPPGFDVDDVSHITVELDGSITVNWDSRLSAFVPTEFNVEEQRAIDEWNLSNPLDRLIASYFG